MKSKFTTLLSALILPSAVCLAGKDTDIKPILAKPGKVLAEDAFTGSSLSKTPGGVGVVMGITGPVDCVGPDQTIIANTSLPCINAVLAASEHPANQP